MKLLLFNSSLFPIILSEFEKQIFMKKRNLIFILTISLFSLDSFAQRNPLSMDSENFFRFGAKAGVNANKITGQSYKSGFNYNYQVGGFLQFNLTRRLGIQPEVSFVQSSSEFTTDANNVYNDLFFNGGQRKAKLNYLEVPVFLNVNIGSSKRVKLQIGPAYNGLLKQTVDSLKGNGSVFKNADWSAIGGLWLQLPLVNIGARYKIGLTDLNAIDDQQTWKNQSIQLFAGITF